MSGVRIEFLSGAIEPRGLRLFDFSPASIRTQEVVFESVQQT